jgi:hypothetical protein
MIKEKYMRFKDKKYRATHTTCKTCCFKEKSRCIHGGFEQDRWEETKECTNKVHMDWYYDEINQMPKDKQKEERAFHKSFGKNWQKLHWQAAKALILKRVHDRIEEEKFFDSLTD